MSQTSQKPAAVQDITQEQYFRLVLPYEMCRILQERGFPQKTIFSYAADCAVVFSDNEAAVVAAPTAQEIIEMLPKKLAKEGTEIFLVIVANQTSSINAITAGYTDFNNINIIPEATFRNPTDDIGIAASNLWLSLDGIIHHGKWEEVSLLIN